MFRRQAAGCRAIGYLASVLARSEVDSGLEIAIDGTGEDEKL